VMGGGGAAAWWCVGRYCFGVFVFWGMVVGSVWRGGGRSELPVLAVGTGGRGSLLGVCHVGVVSAVFGGFGGRGQSVRGVAGDIFRLWIFALGFG